MSEKTDPRVYFAAERTLLAWLRTGIASIGLGFLVARFGYFLKLINGLDANTHVASKAIGIGLVLIGTLMIALASWQHGRFLKTLQPDELPRRYSTNFALIISVLMALSGIALASYLMSATNPVQQVNAPQITM